MLLLSTESRTNPLGFLTIHYYSTITVFTDLMLFHLHLDELQSWRINKNYPIPCSAVFYSTNSIIVLCIPGINICHDRPCTAINVSPASRPEISVCSETYFISFLKVISSWIPPLCRPPHTKRGVTEEKKTRVFPTTLYSYSVRIVIAYTRKFRMEQLQSQI